MRYILSLSLFLPGCATIFMQEDGFSDKMHRYCKSKEACLNLQEEAQDRARRCKHNTVGYVRCDEAKADLLWIHDRVVRFDQQEREEKQSDAEAKRQEAEETRRREREAARERQIAAEAEAAAKAERDAKMKAAVRELEDWASVSPEKCREAKEPDACKGLATYVSTYKAGSVHLEEAQNILTEATPKVTVLQDERKWGESRIADCKKPKKWDACRDVEAYLQSFPEGRHSEEARKTLNGVERVTSMLWAMEEQRRLREERLAEQKRLAEEQAEKLRTAQAAQAHGDDDNDGVAVHRHGRGRVRAPVDHGGGSSGGRRRHRRK